MKVLVPTVITDAMLISSSVPENDYPVWVSGIVYAVGYRVIRPDIHSVFECNVAGSGTIPPENSLTGDLPKWLYVGKTNRWRAFELGSSAQSIGSSDWTYVLQPGTLSGLALFGVTGSQLTVTMTVSGSTVYTQTKPLLQSRATNWYEWLFGGVKQHTSVVLTDLPAYRLALVTVSILGTLPSVRSIAFGLIYFIGGTQRRAEFGITSFSLQKVDQWGTYTFQRRKNTKPLKFVLSVDNDKLESIATLLYSLDSVVCVWIGADDDRLKILTTVGYFQEFTGVVPYLSYTDMSLKIQGI